MRSVWTSRAGVPFPDRVPAVDRQRWVRQGLCPDQDLYTLFRRKVRAHPHKPALIETRAGAGETVDEVLDYVGLDREVHRIAGLFVEAGLSQGDVIALRMPNGKEAVAAELAVYALGAVALPYPLGGGRRDTLALLGRSRASAAVFAETDDLALRAELPHVQAVFTPQRGVTGTTWLGSTPRWERALRTGVVDASSPARVLVSSGSETKPKMVAYAHHAMGARAGYLRALDPGCTERRHLVLVSLASSFGSAGILTVAALGGTLLVQSAFSPSGAQRLLARRHPTHVLAVPTMLGRLAEQCGSGQSFPSLRALVSSGAALPESTAALLKARFGRPVITVYGSSDGVNCHTVHGARPEGSTGVPDPAVARIRVTDPDGEPLPAGRPGEIQAKGPMSPLCYVGSPELDARYRTADGWVRTGDRGLLDERGQLFVLGRLKSIVVRGGYNISLAEVEHELGTHPDLAEVVCVPVEDLELGERLCACVRFRAEAKPPSLPDLSDYLLLERGLEKRKLPELLYPVTQMPLGPTGKICRRSLAAEAREYHGQSPRSAR